MSELHHIDVDGRPATVAFMDAFGGSLVEPDEAQVAVVVWDDGAISHMVLAEPRTLGEAEGHPFHGNQWTGEWSAQELIARRQEVVKRIEKIIGASLTRINVQVSTTQPAIQAARVTADTLQEMKDKGYLMPEFVMVLTENKGLSAVVKQRADLEIAIPVELPAEANLDMAHATAFGGKLPDRPIGKLGNWKHFGRRQYINEDTGEVRDRDPNVTSYDRFAGGDGGFKNLVVHEMGHVQMGRTSGFNKSFPSYIERDAPGILKISAYASTNADEFIAETFVRLYNGETINITAQRLYEQLEGPKIR